MEESKEQLGLEIKTSEGALFFDFAEYYEIILFVYGEEATRRIRLTFDGRRCGLLFAALDLQFSFS